MNPPPLPAAETTRPKGKPFSIAAVIVAAIGLIPMLVFSLVCVGHADSAYRTGGNALWILAMGFIGLLIHGIGLVCGIVGSSMGAKNLGFAGALANGLYLGAILLLGFIAIAIA